MGETTKKYWLMKSEPDEFSIADLKTKKRERWSGVRNYVARNYMMRDMQIGDLVLFYHSNAKPSGVAGLARISALAIPDETAWDRKSGYFDAKSTPDKPRWYCVEVEYVDTFKKFTSLEEIKNTPKLKDMALLRYSRLSVQPVTTQEFQLICKMSGLAKPPKEARPVT